MDSSWIFVLLTTLVLMSVIGGECAVEGGEIGGESAAEGGAAVVVAGAEAAVVGRRGAEAAVVAGEGATVGEVTGEVTGGNLLTLPFSRFFSFKLASKIHLIANCYDL